MEFYLREILEDSVAVKREFVDRHSQDLVRVARLLQSCFSSGGRLYIVGNGGSAADAQHMAAELVGRLLTERPPYPAVALTTDSSNLTALGNDYGYQHVFSRQVRGLARAGDVLLAISTSGNSPNVVRAVQAAKELGCHTVALTGGGGGALAAACDIVLNARLGKNSCRIQETHIFAIHAVVDLLDRMSEEAPVAGYNGA